MELTYRNVNGYLLPNLCVEDMPPLGKYGMLRRSYLRQHHRCVFHLRIHTYNPRLQMLMSKQHINQQEGAAASVVTPSFLAVFY